LPKIQLIDDLTEGSLPPESNLLVEFDPASQWYNSCIAIAAAWVKDGGDVGYNGFVQSPDTVRTQLTRLGLEVDGLERDDRLRIYDWYTPTLGRKSKEDYGIESLKVADQSIIFRLTEDDLNHPEELEWPKSLRIADNFSTLARFNDEKFWIEFMLTRVFPIASARKSTLIFGIMKGVHSEWAYRQLEGAVEGIIDFKLEEVEKTTRDMMRIRSMRNLSYDREWHELRVGRNFDVTIER
jgi:KaiC/GvpD/RAD55 family RecA-like ATPase